MTSTSHASKWQHSSSGALAWYLKPFAGILTDAFPIFGTRRRHYLLFSSVLTALSWIGMGFLPHKYGALLCGAMAVNLFMVMASTVTGAFLVEAGNVWAQQAASPPTNVRV
jgi:hypothetical protein